MTRSLERTCSLVTTCSARSYSFSHMHFNTFVNLLKQIVDSITCRIDSLDVSIFHFFKGEICSYLWYSRFKPLSSGILLKFIFFSKPSFLFVGLFKTWWIEFSLAEWLPWTILSFWIILWYEHLYYMLKYRKHWKNNLTLNKRLLGVSY